jgi:hypothetical protein
LRNESVELARKDLLHDRHREMGRLVVGDVDQLGTQISMLPLDGEIEPPRSHVEVVARPENAIGLAS